MEMQHATRVFDLLYLVPELFPGNRRVFSCVRDSRLLEIDATTYLHQSHTLGCALHEMGIQRGDRIATLLTNRPEWNILDMGIMLAGAVQVPVYPTMGPENLDFIFRDAGIRLLIVENETAWEGLKHVVTDLPGLQEVFTVEKVEGLRCLEDLFQSGYPEDKTGQLKREAQKIQHDDLATVIYTSGTTGRPKGVMLTHSNILSNLIEVRKIYQQTDHAQALSILPLCHVYERIMNYTYQFSGTPVHYVSTFDKLRENIILVKPEILSAVPRMLEKFFNLIKSGGRSRRMISKSVFFWALDLGEKFVPWQPLSLKKKILYKLADLLVYSKIRQQFGGRLKTIISGSASLNSRISSFFWAAGIKVVEGYGLTETSPVIAVGNFLVNGVKPGTVGKPLPSVNVRIAEDGEILVRGPNVMQGYFNRPDRTAEVISHDGWLHTGDVGRFTDDGFLQITDRKKEMFKTSGGKYVAPQVIENKLRESPFIDFVMVLGENRNFPSALIVPGMGHVKSWCRIKGVTADTEPELIHHPRVMDRIAREVAGINATLSHPEQVKAFRLVSDQWSVETGELSPTLKLQRNFILEKYSELIEDIYKPE